MGYYTYFKGSLRFDKPIDYKFQCYLKNFFRTRHFKRDETKLTPFLDRLVPPLTDFGKEGKFFVGSYDEEELTATERGVEYNYPPDDCPSLWCDMELISRNVTDPNDTQQLILVDGKNYNYTSWIEWLIKYIIAPAEFKLNGEISWQGEEFDDRGRISVTDNIVVIEND